jgi:nicotinate-nucleotide--dimethylbenzimidazole phosphoribosyltransferase
MQGAAGCNSAWASLTRRTFMQTRPMPAHAPLDDIRDLIRALPEGDEAAAAATRGAVRKEGRFEGGGLETMAVWLSSWSGRTPPQVNKPVVAIFAGAHGVAGHGVSRSSESRTRDYVAAVSAGQGVLSRLCATGNVGLKMLDLALDVPTGDITQDAALDERACAATIAFGMEAVAGGHDLICLSSIGAGGETSAAAVLAAMFDGKAWPWVGNGSQQHVALREMAAVDAALALHRASAADPLEMMRRLGGREIAAMAGAIIAARMEKVPVILDGLPAFAAAAVLQHVRPDAVAHCMLAAQPPHARAAEAARVIGLECLAIESGGGGPGVDASVGVGLLKAAVLAAG